MADKYFFAKENIRDLFGRLVNGLNTKNVDVNSIIHEDKRAIVKMIIGNMEQLYSKIDKSRITDKNINDIRNDFNSHVLNTTTKLILSQNKKPTYPARPEFDTNRKTNTQISQVQMDRENDMHPNRRPMFRNREHFDNTFRDSRNIQSENNTQANRSNQIDFSNDRYGYKNSNYAENDNYDDKDERQQLMVRKMEDVLAQRERDIPQPNQRPPTPDFTLDGSGKKRKGTVDVRDYEIRGSID